MDRPTVERAVWDFYHRWHLHERTLGRDDGQILDFDMAPGPADAPAPFASRLDALRALGELCAAVADAAALLPGATFLAAKLRGSEAYLRALMGERWAFDAYLRATMGIEAGAPDDATLAEEASALAALFAGRGVAWSEAGRAAFRSVLGKPDVAALAQQLPREAERWVERVRSHIAVPAPEYAIEVVCEDAYWANWIDGSRATGVRLRVNTHDRIEYVAGSETTLAAHEIAGHAVHVAALRRSAERGTVSGAALNLTVHGCEAFQMEGLAQTAMHALAEVDELSADVLLLDRFAAYKAEIVNRAQLEVERGGAVDEAAARALAACPLIKPLTLLSDLRDRGRHPLFRAYTHVYAPSRRLFSRAAALDAARRWRFFEQAYTRLMTPAELGALVEALEAERVPARAPGPTEGIGAS